MPEKSKIFRREQKEELVKTIAEDASKIMGLPVQAMVTITI